MAPRRQVEDLPGLNATSNPATSLQGAIAFAPRDNSLLDLAQSLRGVNRQLGSYFDKQIEQQNEAAIAEGKRLAMLDDAKSYKQYVEKGGEPMASPWVQYGYKQQKGRVLGQSYSAFISDKRLNWEGAGSDDIDGQAIVNEMPKWRQEFLQAQGDLDPVEMTGFDAYAITEEDNTVRSHIANEREQSMKNYETQVYNEFYNLLSDPKLNQQQLHAKIEEVYQRQEFQGLRNMVAPSLLQAVVKRAEMGDVAAIDKVRQFTRVDAKTGQTIPVFKNHKAKAVLDEARIQARRARVSLDNLARGQEQENEVAILKQFERDFARDALDGKKRTKTQVIQEALDKGISPIAAVGRKAAIEEILNNDNAELFKEKRDLIFAEIMLQPRRDWGMGEYAQALREAGGTADDLKKMADMWDSYVSSGKSMFANFPELELYARTAQAGSAVNPISDEEKVMMMAQVMRGLPTPATGDKAAQEKFAKDAKEMFDRRSKPVKASEAGGTGNTKQAFTERFALGADYDSTGQRATKASPAPKVNTRRMEDTSFPVMTPQEINEMRGLSPEGRGGYLRSKSVMPRDKVAKAYNDIFVRKQYDTPEVKELMQAAEAAGINTTRPAVAYKQLHELGQKKFWK